MEIIGYSKRDLYFYYIIHTVLLIWYSRFFLKDILTEVEHRAMLNNKPNIYGNVVFDNVNFAYLSRPNTKVLSDLKFEVRRGETLAIVGSNGSGKVRHHFFSRFFC